MVALPRDPANIGRQYGRLTVEAFAPPSYRGVRVHCVCECGNRTEVQLSSLRLGHTRSCGCLQKEWARTARPRRPAPPPPPPPVVECECGNAKAESDESCARCAWLDGTGAAMALVSALRVLGEVATKDAIIEEMGGGPRSRRHDAMERTFYRALAALRSTNRVVSVLPSGGLGDAIDPKQLRYVSSMRDEKDDPMRGSSGRGGYYVFVPKKRKSEKHGDGSAALHVLMNTRRVG